MWIFRLSTYIVVEEKNNDEEEQEEAAAVEMGEDKTITT